ncbi:MAG: triose-phosphate isomerase [bacterium]|nr:triose-phosphate isomerase [bacterium]MDZ4296591.1 triose-phosphate isomerase [Patescibacteria group bacterium]
MKYLIANWKMNPETRPEVERWMATYAASGGMQNGQCRVVVCPPFVWLPVVADRHPAGISIGAQDVFWETKGAWTGEISAGMLKGIGCAYVIVGHSERRALGESDAAINAKLKAAIEAGLTPILAVGEKSRKFTRQGTVDHDVDEILEMQLKGALRDIPKTKLKEFVIAYEPVWAIGTGMVANSDDALRAALFIRKTVAEIAGQPRLRKTLPVLYGGSVTAKNISPFLEEDGLDGVLVGAASLDVGEFLEMQRQAAERPTTGN